VQCAQTHDSLNVVLSVDDVVAPTIRRASLQQHAGVSARVRRSDPLLCPPRTAV
jgi:hypothetical protein